MVKRIASVCVMLAMLIFMILVGMANFTALAPYVESDSYLSFEGEDGAEWIWKFNHGKVEYVSKLN